MVCIAIKGQPVIGIIYKPFETQQNLFWAWSNHGTSRNLRNLPKVTRIILHFETLSN